MKQTLLPSSGRGRFGRAHTQSLLLALALGWLGAGASPALAQDQTVPQALTIQTLEVTNLPSGPAASISYSIAGSKVFYFPVYAIWTIQYKDAGGQFRPLFDAAGNHLLPSTLTSAELCFTVRDYLKNGTLQQEIIQYLRNSPVVHDQAPAGVPVPAAIENPAPPARLILTRGLNNTTLGSGLLATAQGNEFPKASVFLDSAALAALRAAPQPAARALRLSVDHTYRAQFINFDLTVNLSTTESSLAQMVGSLTPIPAGRPTYLLSSRLPTMLPGGGVDRDVQFISQVRSATQVQVLQRAGSQVSPTMIDRMLDTALNQANLAVQIATAERQRAIATILLDDGLSITLPLGRLNEVAAEIRTDSNREWSDAFISSATKQQNNEVKGSASASFLGFGGSASADVNRNWSRSDYVSRKREDFAHNLEEMSARLSGDIPVVTGIRFTDAGTVLNVNVRNLEQSIGQFTTGLADYPAVRSLKEDADRQSQAQRVETMMVPQVLVGTSGEVGYDGWNQSPGAWSTFKDVQVTFPKPFAVAPEVVAAIQTVNASRTPELVRVSTINITATGFTMRFQAHPTSIYYWAEATWIASGQKAVNASGGIGLATTPGGPALIPAEARQAVLTPQLQSAPQLVGGKFSASFNAIPGRTYNVEASSTMRPDDWSFLGSVIASDFLAGFDMADIGSHPQRFFRISTP